MTDKTSFIKGAVIAATAITAPALAQQSQETPLLAPMWQVQYTSQYQYNDVIEIGLPNATYRCGYQLDYTGTVIPDHSINQVDKRHGYSVTRVRLNDGNPSITKSDGSVFGLSGITARVISPSEGKLFGAICLYDIKTDTPYQCRRQTPQDSDEREIRAAAKDLKTTCDAIIGSLQAEIVVKPHEIAPNNEARARALTRMLGQLKLFGANPRL